MIQSNIKYISGADGKVNEVILPLTVFKEMVETIEDKELLRLMKEVEAGSPSYLSEEESFDLLNDLIDQSEI